MASPQRVSVITATYRGADYLPQCIESVLNQTYPHVEHIVVDDASPDGTAEIVAGFAHRGVRYARLSTNSGQAAARNEGIRLSSGEWIAFLDDDDYWLPQRLSAMMSAIQTDTDLVTSDFLYDDGGVVSSTSAYRGRHLEWLFDLPAEEQFEALLEDGFLAISMMMVPRKVLNRVGLFDESFRACEDYNLWLRCMAAGSRVVCALEPLGVIRRLRPGSITAARSDRHVEERLCVMKPYLHLCSGARSSKIRGEKAYRELLRGLRARRISQFAKPALSLLFNPSFVWSRVCDRLGLPHRSGLDRLAIFRDRLMRRTFKTLR